MGHPNTGYIFFAPESQIIAVSLFLLFLYLFAPLPVSNMYMENTTNILKISLPKSFGAPPLAGAHPHPILYMDNPGLPMTTFRS